MTDLESSALHVVYKNFGEAPFDQYVFTLTVEPKEGTVTRCEID